MQIRGLCQQPHWCRENSNYQKEVGHCRREWPEVSLGYCPNVSKSVLIVKQEFYKQMKETFRDSEVKVTKNDTYM